MSGHDVPRMDPVYVGTDAEFADRLAVQLVMEHIPHQVRVARPDRHLGYTAVGYLVEVASDDWRRALECVDGVRRGVGADRDAALRAAQAFAADQANRRGRMEGALIAAMLIGAVLGFLVHPAVVKTPACRPMPFTPPALIFDAPAGALPAAPEDRSGEASPAGPDSAR